MLDFAQVVLCAGTNDNTSDKRFNFMVCQFHVNRAKILKGYMNINLVSSQIFQPVKNLSGASNAPLLIISQQWGCFTWGKPEITVGKSNGLIPLGTLQKIGAVIWGKAIFPLFLVCSVNLDAFCSSPYSYHTNIFSFMFMHQCSTQVLVQTLDILLEKSLSSG